MFLLSDTSDISDWKWIAGGFPCRDMIRECLISDNHTSHQPTSSSLDSQLTQANTKSEILDEQPQTSDPLECPISIIPAEHSTTNPQSASKLSHDLTTETTNTPTDRRKEVEGDKFVDFSDL